jgi:cell division septal protein FtsQ
METYEHSFLQHPIIEKNTEMLDQYAKMDGTITKLDEQYSALDADYKYNTTTPSVLGKNSDLYNAGAQVIGAGLSAYIGGQYQKKLSEMQADLLRQQNQLNYSLGIDRNKLDSDIAQKKLDIEALLGKANLEAQLALQGSSQTEKLKQRKTIILLVGGGVLLLGSLGLFLFLRKKRAA